MTIFTPTICIPTLAILKVNTRPITGYLKGGTFLTIEPDGDDGAVQDGLHGDFGMNAIPGSVHSFALTIMQKSPDWIALHNLRQLQKRTGRSSVLSFRYGLGPSAQVFANGMGMLINISNQEIVGDGNQPAQTFTFRGGFATVKPGIYQAPVPITRAEMEAQL